MNTTISRPSPSLAVRFIGGVPFACPVDAPELLFWAVLGRVLATDLHAPSRLNGWNAVVRECERELHFIAGQFAAGGSALEPDELFDEFCCWLDEVERTLGAEPPQKAVHRQGTEPVLALSR